MCQTTNPVFTTEPASAKPGIGSKIGAAFGLAFAALGAVLATIGVKILQGIGTAIRAIVGFIAAVAYETLIACRYFVLAGVAVMALLWFWSQGSKELGNKPAEVGFFEGLGGRTETRGGVKVFQTFWGKTYAGIPYIGWRDATADVEAMRAAQK